MARDLRAEAEEFIDAIRRDNGGLTVAQRESLPPEILQIFNNLRRKLGAATKTLATNLYAKDTRFVFELIQNAEDNQYLLAERTSQMPSLHFTVTHDCIIIDSNEDGFDQANIKALCSVGESTKACQAGYIGEKGIGFKSVFKVARKVHVQSQQYSFAFEYSRDGNDDGLGMVTPFNEPREILPDGIRTRMTLHLLESCDRQSLITEFRNLPDTLLLFLKKLRRLSVTTPGFGGQPMVKEYTIGFGTSRANISIREYDKTSVLHFWTIRKTIGDMPRHESRRGITTAELVLGFPMNVDETPRVEEQHVFAYLPLRKLGFKFLIQSDFITQASREDVFDCDWNNRLLDEVVNLFLSNILNFLQHPILKYQWLRYISVVDLADEFWSKLQRMLLARVPLAHVYMTRAGNLVSASQLRHVQDAFKDTSGDPLLPDNHPRWSTGNFYKAEQYGGHLDMRVLRKFGLKNLDHFDFVSRLEVDMARREPRMHTLEATSAWQERVAGLLAIASDNVELRRRLGLLSIIPLTSGFWAKSLNASIFWPTTGGTDIPRDLGLNMVSELPLQVASRKSLFTKLGVEECDPTRIFPLIEQRYNNFESMCTDVHKTHIRFIWWHHDKLPYSLPKILFLKSTPSGAIYFNPHKCGGSRFGKGRWIYTTGLIHTYAACNILDGRLRKELENDLVLLHSDYDVWSAETATERNGITLKAWVSRALGVRQFIELRARYDMRVVTSESSKEFDTISTSRPDLILGVIAQHKSEILGNRIWDTQISVLKVPICHSTLTKELGATFLPTPALVSTVQRLKLEQDFGFLKELESLTEEKASDWHFLGKFGVNHKDDFSFWLHLAQHARALERRDVAVMAEIYQALNRLWRGTVQLAALRSDFGTKMILLPGENGGSWCKSNECVWSGPSWYHDLPKLLDVPQYKDLQNFFKSCLLIPDVGLDHFLTYLGRLAGNNQNPGSTPTAIYSELAKGSWTEEQKLTIVSFFNSTSPGLVYTAASGKWHPLQNCVWAEDKIELPGKVSIATTFANQKSLFVDILKVEAPSIKMHVNALLSITLDSPSKETVLAAMRNISALRPLYNDLRPLHSQAVIPCRTPSGSSTWLKPTDNFTIIDRRSHLDIFATRLTRLDMSIEDVHDVRTLLSALGLQSRFSSLAIKEETKVEGGVCDEQTAADLCSKAYAICRFAAHHKSTVASNDALATYRRLAAIKVFQSDGIISIATIRQGNEDIKVTLKTGYFHMEEQDGSLAFYIPKSQRDRYVCLSDALPQKLLKYLGVADQSCVSTLGTILGAPGLDVVDTLLERYGIISVEGISRPEGPNQGTNEPTSQPATPERLIPRVSLEPAGGQQVLRPPPSTPNALAVQTIGRPVTPTSSNRWQGLDFNTPSSTGSSSPAPSFFTPHRPQDYWAEQYKQLLDFVIKAGQDPTFDFPPANSEYSHTALTPPPELDISRALYSATIGEDKFMTGAAGELLVYELLKGVRMPAFTARNWQSTIRGRVAVHEAYRELRAWLGSETSDIVFDDTDQKFTTMLLNRGYLSRSIALSPSIKYYMEVKATTGRLAQEFYVSQNQLDLMERTTLQSSTPVTEVYIIARVYNLGQKDMGVALYLDPAQLKRDGALIFRADKYAVSPGRA